MRLQELKFDWKAVTVIIVSTLALTVDHYHLLLGDKVYDRLLLYLAVPLLVILLVFRESPARYGFGWGDWKAGLALTALGCGGMAVVLWFLARTPDLQRYYTGQLRPLLPLLLETGGDLVGWEFFFRGFLLFGLYRVCGTHAIILQAVPFALAHLGKPEVEALSCIFGGSAFGYLAWRTRSFLYPFLIHWFIMTFAVLVAGGVLG